MSEWVGRQITSVDELWEVPQGAFLADPDGKLRDLHSVFLSQGFSGARHGRLFMSPLTVIYVEPQQEAGRLP